MTDEWAKRERALEDGYFERKEREALERLAKKAAEGVVRKSPISGEPMVQKSLYGVVVDRCTTSGGIWLDAGELEQIIEMAKKNEPGFLEKLFSGLRS